MHTDTVMNNIILTSSFNSSNTLNKYSIYPYHTRAMALIFHKCDEFRGWQYVESGSDFEDLWETEKPSEKLLMSLSAPVLKLLLKRGSITGISNKKEVMVDVLRHKWGNVLAGSLDIQEVEGEDETDIFKKMTKVQLISFASNKKVSTLLDGTNISTRSKNADIIKAIKLSMATENTIQQEADDDEQQEHAEGQEQAEEETLTDDEEVEVEPDEELIKFKVKFLGEKTSMMKPTTTTIRDLIKEVASSKDKNYKEHKGSFKKTEGSIITTVQLVPMKTPEESNVKDGDVLVFEPKTHGGGKVIKPKKRSANNEDKLKALVKRVSKPKVLLNSLFKKMADAIVESEAVLTKLHTVEGYITSQAETLGKAVLVQVEKLMEGNGQGGTETKLQTLHL